MELSRNLPSGLWQLGPCDGAADGPVAATASAPARGQLWADVYEESTESYG